MFKHHRYFSSRQRGGAFGESGCDFYSVAHVPFGWRRNIFVQRDEPMECFLKYLGGIYYLRSISVVIVLEIDCIITLPFPTSSFCFPISGPANSTCNLSDFALTFSDDHPGARRFRQLEIDPQVCANALHASAAYDRVEDRWSISSDFRQSIKQLVRMKGRENETNLLDCAVLLHMFQLRAQ